MTERPLVKFMRTYVEHCETLNDLESHRDELSAQDVLYLTELLQARLTTLVETVAKYPAPENSAESDPRRDAVEAAVLTMILSKLQEFFTGGTGRLTAVPF